MRVLSLSRWLAALGALTVFAPTFSVAQDTTGIMDLVKRRLPNHADHFSFEIVNSNSTLTSSAEKTAGKSNDCYTISTLANGTVHVQGNSLSALSSGLHRYLTDIAHVDIYWYIGSRLHLAPAQLPALSTPLSGCSIVPWRYHFNTVTFSYTAAFWSWEDWELELDWMALRGINLPLAWVGYEKLLLDVYREIGMTDEEVISFFSGPAFQAWNRFGNEQGSWGGQLPLSWIDDQFELQKKIIARMVELGITPVLPAFTGFVPTSFTRVKPSANVVNGSQWSGFPTKFTNDTFLDPQDPAFAQLQSSFISKQIAAYGNVTKFYTLDQYNENNPFSGDLGYLRNVTFNTWKTLKAADPSAVWMMQGWLFFSSSTFWTNDRIQAYLSGVEVNSDMLILDLFSEAQPQWQRTNSYFGKPWIWCQLHDYGGNMGLYGTVANITVNPTQALANSSSLVGFGLTPEGQEGNEIVYDLLLDQAWAPAAIDTKTYFYNWVTNRYAGTPGLPGSVYSAWEILRTTVYNNTNLTSNAVSKGIYELAPDITGLVNRTSHHPTTINYNTTLLVQAWNLFYNASLNQPLLWDNPAYTFDLVDFTRQVISNAFTAEYSSMIAAYHTANQTSSTMTAVSNHGSNLLTLLSALDTVLLTNKHFTLSTWISSALSWVNSTATATNNSTNSTTTPPQNNAAFYEYNARNQITLWGPDGEINDYASKAWGGLVGSYYIPRWEMLLSAMNSTTAAHFNSTTVAKQILAFGETWCNQTWGEQEGEVFGTVGEVWRVLPDVVKSLPAVFGADNAAAGSGLKWSASGDLEDVLVEVLA